jgi:pentatricopeptide repeat protein
MKQLPDTISYTSCIRAAARAKQPEMVRELLRQMQQGQVQLDTWHLLGICWVNWEIRW